MLAARRLHTDSFHPSAAMPSVPSQPFSPADRHSVFPGLALSAAVGAGGLLLGQVAWFGQHGLSSLTIAIVLGMLVGNLVPGWTGACHDGVGFSKQRVLRAAIVLYGLRLAAQDIGQLGLAGIAVDVFMLCSTFALACWIGTRWLGMDRRTAMLIGAGSSICGAAAVIATEPVVQARSEQVTVAVATVVVFGTISIFLYPILFEWNRHLGLVPGGMRGFGLYVGSTVHEVAQVVAAARSIGAPASGTAVIAKMFRVIMLAPFLMALSGWLARSPAPGANGASRTRIAVPWFAVSFLAVVLLHSVLPLPATWVHAGLQIDDVLLCTAMAALGLSTQVASVRHAGVRPLVLAACLFCWLVIAGAFVNRGIDAALGL
jgi:uncharacterized integral membrane protein (TIGR00698 family)